MATSASRAAQRHSPKRPVVQRTPAAKPRRPPTTIVPAATPAQLLHELASCLTEADILQVLYRNLQPRFGYDVILLTVLERDGWYRVLPIDSGVLQDSRRRPVSGSAFARQYANPQLTVLPAGSKTQQAGRGPGTGQRIRFVIWAPVEHQGQLIGAVVYQSHRSRRVPPAEISFLEEVHRRFGVLLANAALNELTRNQDRRLEALNSVARALASTLDESSVLKALHSTLSELLPVETVEIATLEDRESGTTRLLRLEAVNAIGRRLAASLDRWSIMRTLREELGAFLNFDGFILATISQTPEGPVAEGYQYVAGVEEVVPPVALAVAGPSREAYETGVRVLVRNNPWRRAFEEKEIKREVWTVGQGAAVFVSAPPTDPRRISRSFVWVPVLSGDRITAMLSLQS